MNQKNDQAPPHPTIPNPREFMRARHPDLFSDTQVDDVPQLPRPVFEYHLETLTSRKQEYEFEHFCRKLSEKELCPNLRVQTGPTGGGDSKVDTETYPVAKEIAERWWIGSPAAGAERWAFAFSAKKRWKSKIKADVDNILSTGRDYKHIYFFTNQFVSDKQRADQEDTLSKHAKIPVHIIDRAWLVEKVYEADHLELAIAALGIDARSERRTRPGPRDTERLAELEELDQRVADPSCYQGARYQLVEDCLRSALLARGLERPRNEVEARFVQADQLSKDLDYRPQRLRIAYNRAWTTYFWYEDYSTFSQFYEEVEQHLEDSDQAHEVQLLWNLWQLLMPSVAEGRIAAQDAQIESRRQRLAAMLEPMAADPLRLNNALQARTSLIFMRIRQAAHAGQSDQLESCWPDLEQIVDECAALGAYPVEQLSGLVAVLGEFMDGPAFDSLYEKLTDVIRQRRSDGAAGEAHSRRALQKLRQGKPYEAIRWFGRAEELLIKEEYQADLVLALLGSSAAYEHVGLLWAARNKALAAVERTLAVFNEQGTMPPQALIAMKRLVWIELQLGRIPQILTIMAFESLISSHLHLSEEQQKTYAEEWEMQEGVLSIHFLNLPFEALSSVTRLPDTLERLDLVLARMALLFALGHEQGLRDEGYIPASEDSDAVQTFFESWQDQLTAEDIPPQPELADGTTCSLKAIILGSELVVETPNNVISVSIAESLLGALEAFLATSADQDVFPHRERMTIVVRASQGLAGGPQLRFPDGGGGDRAEIVYPLDMTFTTADERQDYMEWLQDSLIEIACRLLMIQDVQAWLEKIVGQERGFSRALAFGDALTLDTSVFGETARVRLTDWLKPDAQDYAVLRDGPWREVKPSSPDRPMESPQFASGPPPPDMMDTERLKHTDRRVLSPIDVPLWDQAKWRGILFVCLPDVPPILAIGFEDGRAGQAIFRAWKERLGDVDKDEAIRVAVITELSKRNPAEYAVVVGPNLQQMGENNKKVVMTVSRIQRMSPNTSTNLDNFLAAYEEAGAFLLAPAQFPKQEPFIQFAIVKRHLDLRQAWQIGENDSDISVLADADEPLIPAGVTDPPINKALVRIRNMSRRR